MTQGPARYDANFIYSLLAAPSLDPSSNSPVPLVADESTNELLVQISSASSTLPLPTGASTSAKQLPDDHNVTVSNIASTPVISGFATSAKQDILLTELQLKADLTETQPVSNASLPLPTGASTSAKQLADNHQVTVSNPTADPETGLATSAKQLADGHNVQINALSAIYEGTKTVPTGTAEAITTTQTIHSVTVKALSTNTVAVYVGGTGVTVSGFELLAGESVSLDVTNLATVFCISGSSSQVVRYIAI